jgi:hypothetical protein
VAGTGCPTGERCTLFSVDEGTTWQEGCVPVTGPLGGAGDACALTLDAVFGYIDDCGAGLMCSDNGRGTPICARLCTESDPSTCAGAFPEGDGLCLLTYSGMSPGLKVCLPPSLCDPRCQDCGEPGLGCYPTTDGLNFGTICFPFVRSPDLSGDGTTGQVCDFVNSCAPGYFCWIGGTADQCRPFCDLGGTSTCEFATCGGHEGAAVEGTCQDPGAPYTAEMFGDALDRGLCLLD